MFFKLWLQAQKRKAAGNILCAYKVIFKILKPLGNEMLNFYYLCNQNDLMQSIFIT